ncbi:serine-rich adhesin for platelets [Linepithema humile]|uniref:serine-rich adhesin for platelets n=1 Tax=Linepithema humile TaxID=83485 RepID=UPI00351F7F18
MASATMMGLRRRAPVNSSPTPSSQSPSTATSTSSSSKRSRNENNNSPSHGNLNSMNGGSRDEPPTKKSRGTSTSGAKGNSCSSPATCSASSSTTTSASTADNQNSKSRGTSVSRSATQTKSSSTSTASSASSSSDISKGSALATSWSATSNMSDMPSYASVAGLSLTGGQTAGLCAGSLSMPPAPIAPYMSTSIATFVGNATNLGKSSSVSYLDISNMTGGSLAASGTANSLNNGYAANGAVDPKSGIAMSYSGMSSPSVNGGSYGVQKGQGPSGADGAAAASRKFQNDAMFTAYQPWVIKTYGDLAKTKTITIKKYARILRTLRGEEANSAENSKFRFWVKNKGFHIGQPDGYDAKPADRIIGRHAVTSPGLDPPLYVPAMPPHNKSLNGAEGTVPQGKVYKKVAIVENFFDIIHAVHVDLEGRPGKHAGQKRTYRTITETYAFLPREAVTRFLLGCTECQRRPRTPSPTNLSNQSQSTVPSTALASTPLNSNTGGGNAALATLSSSASSAQSSSKPRDSNHHASEGKNLHNYRHQKQHKNSSVAATDKLDKDKDEKYNPLSITNLLKKEPVNGGFLANSDNLPESRRTPESDRASSRSSASSKRKRMLPEGRTPSPQPSQPLPRPWSPGLDPKNTPIDYSRPITTSYLKHQQRLLQAEKSKAAANALRESEAMELNSLATVPTPLVEETESVERERFSPATGLIGTNLKILGTIPHLHFQVMLALTERLRPSIAVPGPLVLPPAPTNVLAGSMMMGTEVSVQTGENHL